MRPKLQKQRALKLLVELSNSDLIGIGNYPALAGFYILCYISNCYYWYFNLFQSKYIY